MWPDQERPGLSRAGSGPYTCRVKKKANEPGLLGWIAVVVMLIAFLAWLAYVGVVFAMAILVWLPIILVWLVWSLVSEAWESAQQRRYAKRAAPRRATQTPE